MPGERRDAGKWMRNDQTQGKKTTDHSAVRGYTGRRASARQGVGEPERLDRPHVDDSRKGSARRTMAHAD
jgi:hypothetical protein